MKMMKLVSTILASAILYSLQPVQAQSIPRSYVAFVVDNTGSMSGEIAAVKTWIGKCINGIYEDECKHIPSGGWILSPFNDPVTKSGPVIGPTTVKSEILQGVDDLEAPPGSGGDCPELAMHGIMSALHDVTPHNVGCQVFFFTDATPKDHSRFEEVKKELMTTKRCTFYPVLTGCCGPCSDPCLTLPKSYCETNVENKLRPRRSVVDEGTGNYTDERAYYHLAYATGGKIHLLNKAQKEGHFLKFLEEELKIGSCPTDEIAGPPPNGFNEEDCRFTKSCWDGRNKTCYCHKRGKCPAYTTTHPPPDCRSSKGVTFLVDYNNCSKYYMCYMGKRYHFDCQSGTAFHRALLRCDSLKNMAPPCGTNGK